MSTTPYELEYLEETHSDGSIKHTYIEPSDLSENPVAKPLDLQEAPIYEIIKDFLNQLNIKPSILILRDLRIEQSITISCSEADNLPDIITKVLSEEDSPLHSLYSIPSADALIADIELNTDRYLPEQAYRIAGNQIVKAD